MKYFVKRVWASAILSILIMVTAVTTTYARYVMTYNNDVEEFNFNISGSNSVYISMNGTDFTSDISSIEVKKAILDKKGYFTDGMSNSQMESVFENILLEPITPKNHKNLSEGFETVENEDSNSYLSFDIYLTSDYVGTSSLGQLVNFGWDDMIEASSTLYDLTYFNVGGLHPTLGNINKKLYLNVSNACRIGISKSVVTDIGDLTDIKNGDDVIYTTGSETPIARGDYYSFGGIHTEDNVALNYYNYLSNKSLEVPQNDRQDIEIDNNEVISRSEGLISGRMIKLSVYVWLEGWDPDCFDVLKGQTFDFGLSFTTLRSS